MLRRSASLIVLSVALLGRSEPAGAQSPSPLRPVAAAPGAPAAPSWSLRDGADGAAPKPVPGPFRSAAPAPEPGRIDWLGAPLDAANPIEPPPIDPPAADMRPRAGAAVRAADRRRTPATRPPPTGTGAVDAIPARAVPVGTIPVGALVPASPALRPSVAPAAVAPVPPVPPGLRGSREDPFVEPEDPFAQQGLRVGGFLLLPAIEVGAGRTSNIQGSATGTPGAVVSLDPEVRLRSDWSRHALEFDLRGSYLGYPGQRDNDRPSLTARATGRVDLAVGMRLDLRGSYAFQRESAGSVENPVGTQTPSNVETVTASAGFTRDVGRLFVTLRGDLEQARYTGGTLQGGGEITTAGLRDNIRLVGALRGGLTLSPAFKPYVEAQLSRRDYADAAAAATRDADGYGLRVGAEVDMGPLLKGDIAAGWAVERPRAGAFDTMSGATFDGALIWSPTRLTTVTLNAKTAFEPTTLAGSSGAVAHTVGLMLSQSLGRQWAAEAGATVTARRYQGIGYREAALGTTAALIWKLNPTMQLFLRGRYDRSDPSTPETAYDAKTLLVGLRLQR